MAGEMICGRVSEVLCDGDAAIPYLNLRVQELLQLLQLPGKILVIDGFPVSFALVESKGTSVNHGRSEGQAGGLPLKVRSDEVQECVHDC
jgi:hypothetical protein